MKGIFITLIGSVLYLILPVENVAVREHDRELHEKNRVNLDLQPFYVKDLKSEEKSHHDNLVNIVDNYIQRYINLFLLTSNLRDYKVTDLNEIILVDMQISVSGEDLVYLQQYTQSIKQSTLHRNLSKLDEILSNIARLKEKDFMEKAKSSLTIYLSHFFSSVFSKSELHPYYVLLTVLIVVFLINRIYFMNKFYTFIILVVNSLVFWDSLIYYRRKLKEVSLELHVRSLQLKGVPKDCFPENQSWYHRMVNYFTGTDCLQYFKLLQREPIDEVSLFQCIIETFSFYYVRMPMKIFGTTIKDYAGEISDLWPWPFNKIAGVPMAILFSLLFIFLVIVVFGNRIRFSFLGAALEINHGSKSPKIMNKNLKKEFRAVVDERNKKVLKDRQEKKTTLLKSGNLRLRERRRKFSL